MDRIVWSRRAADDLESICSHIELDSVQHARRVAQRILEVVEAIVNMPEAGSIVPEYDDPRIRERLALRFRIIYRISGVDAEVVMIRHSARLLPSQFPE